MDILLHELPELVCCTVEKRPSKHIKSPYVADIQIDGENYLGHTPALGCCGLVNAGASVCAYKLEGKKCDYRICISEFQEKGHTIRVGTAPKMAEKIAETALRKNLIKNLDCKTIKREKKILNSRFDFIGRTTDDIPFVLEVKNVPLADYEDIYASERKKRNYDSREWDSKVAYFPDGYRKKVTDTVSPRALKHVNELRELKEEYGSKIRCLLLFVIQRDDVCGFQPSRIDPIYLEAVRYADKGGVEIVTLQVKWIDNKAYYVTNDLPIYLYDDH